ncbi:MAG TPA: molybdopterin dinucleotide binding domain-containing protein, partial [Gammaproteobacteria bacterium]|nr:molybdopterin dinucleotide binding domain-containing protein [Gammaproteobacteria bacterium]
IHPADAEQLGLSAGALVQVSSRRGSVRLKALPTTAVARNTIFIPMHFREAAANLLTDPSLDPLAKIPEFKVCAVKLEAVLGD